MSRAEEQALKVYPDSTRDELGILTFWGYSQRYRDCFIKGYETAEKDLGWISVKDRLPGPSEWVVACIEQHGHSQCLTLATYNEETKEWHTDNWEDGEQETYNPDYWMPIPNRIKRAKE